MKNSFTIYNASAGSGKTFTLVKEYLLLLFESDKKEEYRNILAITFTNKAVDEMKSRIIDSLYAFSSEEIPEKFQGLFEAVCSECKLNKTEIREKAGNILRAIIHNYAAFEVSTIDGFTHRVLRTFAKDLGLPVNFEVELSQEDILLEAVESLVNKAGSDKMLTNILLDFTLNKADDDKSWDITRDLFEISRLLINENNHSALQQLRGKDLDDFQNFDRKLKDVIAFAQDEIREAADSFFKLIQANNIEEKEFTRGSVPKHFRKLQNAENVNFDTQWAKSIAEDNLYSKALSAEKKAVLDQLQPEIVKLFQASKENYFKVEFLQEVRKRLVQLSLLNAINQEIEAIKKDRNLVLISEFNPQISAQVKDQPAPFIYERLGERYNNYFIDEFQDTSQMQWENLIPLIDASLAGMDEESPAGLMLVGDAKQSIYRWRGGKAEQFIDLSNNTNPFSTPKNVIDLPANYRSAEEIVEFNNDFFGFAAGYLTHPDYRRLFEKSLQKPTAKKGGYVNISFLEAENREEEFELYPEKVLEIIKNLESKNYKKGDICILTRKKKEGIAIANHLSENGIAVVSSETLLISNSPKVNFIADLLAFSLSPEDDLLKLSIFDYLQEELKFEDPHKVISENINQDGEDFFRWLKEKEIGFSLNELLKLSIYEAAEYTIRCFQLIEDSDAYLQFFLDFIYENSQKAGMGLSEFLEIWQREKDRLSIVVPQDENAVQIMTIHKSKGLEFPVVIYPFANSDFNDTKRDNLWLEMEEPISEIPVSYLSASKKMLNWNPKSGRLYEELLHQKELDTLNVFYVACTRASKQLYLLSNYDLDKKGIAKTNKISGLLIEFLRNKGVWKDDQKNYDFGQLPQAQQAQQQESDTLFQQHFYSSATQNQAVNIVTRSGSLWDTKQQGAIEKGEIAHGILAKINSAEDIENAVKEAVIDGSITTGDAPEIKTLLKKICEHPQLSSYFTTETQNYNERDLLTSEGKKLRPDRMVLRDKNCVIIDYKTGGAIEAHKNQLNGYAQVLEEMGFKVERKILVYINEEVSPMFV
ncbi:UvrD-helicase domain-containing protein [Zunongwangia sp. F363]|uniref:DNA 3'-5' helicase n=1 Tax=Autumnicola tepida TaxID=3075595 RepID=A0ABU3CB96_9FLAO|nr:UvrD-helicase domain-containing protein [Zunongwangia sp. F363]MDT0643610.1 UvrD-helicase domain-containing protein [Zunongwangia sp. F363]